MKPFARMLLLLSFIAYQSLAHTTPDCFPLSNPGFVENKGQVMDQHGKMNKEVRFIFSQDLFNLQLKNDGFSYELFEVRNLDTGLPESGLKRTQNDDPDMLMDEHYETYSHRIDVKFVRANTSPEIIAEDASDFTLNFYTAHIPEEGVTNVQSYFHVTYKNVYPGIDLVFSAPDENGSKLKYDWIIHPGADPSKIRLQYEGATGIISNTGNPFQIMTSKGIITESNPIAFLEHDGSPVPVSYKFERNEISYQLPLPVTNTVIIDPDIIWDTYFGGNNDEDIVESDLGLDKNGNVLITGTTKSTLYIASSGAYQTTYGGGMVDGFIAKLKPTGKLSWATYYGGSDKDEGHAIVADKSNNIYVGGLTHSSSNIATSGAHQTVFGGISDMFLVKFSTAGIRQWCTYLGGTKGEQLYGEACDSFGNIFFTGYTESKTQIATPGAHQDTLNGPVLNGGDAFLGEFTPSGTLVWCTYESGPGQDRGHGIAIGRKGNLFVNGTCESTTEMASPGAFQTIYGGGLDDAFISKWDTNGNFYWCTYYGGTGDDRGRRVITDTNGDLYVEGFTTSPSGLSSTGSYQANWYASYDEDSTALYDGWVARFRPNGTRVWGSYYGGEGKDQAMSLAIDNANQCLYLVGPTESATNISSAGSFQPTFGGDSDGFIAKFTLTGTRTWGSYIGNTSSEELYDAEMDKFGFLYLYMRTGGTFPITPNVYQTVSHGHDETVVIKFNPGDNCLDSYEPNNSSSTPKTLSTFSDSTLYGYTGSISSATDTDWFRIKIQATNLKIELTDLTADYDMKLYKANGQLVNMSTHAGTADESITYNNAPGAVYLIKVYPVAGASDPTSCYKIKPMTKTSAWTKTGSFDDFTSWQVNVFPNPTSGQISLKVTAIETQAVTITLVNTIGQQIFSSGMNVESGTSEIRLPDLQLSDGIYLLEVKNGEKKITNKIVVQL